MGPDWQWRAVRVQVTSCNNGGAREGVKIGTNAHHSDDVCLSSVAIFSSKQEREANNCLETVLF